MKILSQNLYVYYQTLLLIHYFMKFACLFSFISKLDQFLIKYNFLMKIIKAKILNFKDNPSNFFKHLIVSQITFNKCNFSHFIHNDAFNNFYIFIFTGLRNVFVIIFANAKVII